MSIIFVKLRSVFRIEDKMISVHFFQVSKSVLYSKNSILSPLLTVKKIKDYKTVLLLLSDYNILSRLKVILISNNVHFILKNKILSSLFIVVIGSIELPLSTKMHPSF